MRATITLTPDAEAEVRRTMAERGLSFEDAVNDAIARSAAVRPRSDLTWPTFDLRLRFDPAETNDVLAMLDVEVDLPRIGSEG